jgi:Leucine-rich repeat (LRR) protein
MECFIIKEGVEQKAELKDIIPLIDENREFRDIIFRLNQSCHLEEALAYLPDEMKNKIYRNMSPRISGNLKYYVEFAETNNKEDSEYIKRAREKIIESLGKHTGIWLKECQGQIVWKGMEQNETEQSEMPSDSVRKLITKIEEACNSGNLWISSYDRDITVVDIQNAFSAFQNRRDELRKIRSLDIPQKDLHTTALLFEEGTIEKLKISGDFCCSWPPFMEKCHALTSVKIDCLLSGFPSWIRNAVSLSELSIKLSNNAFVPDWIGDMQSLTELSLGGCYRNDNNLMTIPDSIGNMKKLVRLGLNGLPIEKLPESIGNLQLLTELSLCPSANMKTLPDSICNLKNLVRLDLHGGPIEKLPDSIGNLQSLTELSVFGGYKKENNLRTIPDSIGNLKNMTKLVLYGLSIEKLPESIGNLQSLTELSLNTRANLKYLPDSIGSLKNLVKFHLYKTSIEKLPDSIGDLQLLTELLLYDNKTLKNFPDSIGNLKNLIKLELRETPIEKLPDSIGNLQSLTELSLYERHKEESNLKTLPDSIGNLKNLTKLQLNGLPIEKLPDKIVNCKALEHINICGTDIREVPSFISSVKRFWRSTQFIPSEKSVSYRSFCNHYYMIAETVILFSEIARREGLLALDDCIDPFSGDFLYCGLRLVVDGTDYEIIQHIMTTIIEREHDFYRKKLMEIAMDGVLSIQSGYNTRYLVFKLTSLVDIENNPLDAACTSYFTGNCEAFSNIDFKSAILPEEECEEVRFIKRAMFLNETSRREDLLVLEEHLDHDGIAKKDIFEYGLPLVIDRWDIEIIDDILSRLIVHELNPVRKNFALAKKEAVMSLHYDENTYIMGLKLCAYFDESIKRIIFKDGD